MTTSLSLTDLMAGNERAQHIAAWQDYRSLLGDAASMEQLAVRAASYVHAP